MISCEYVRGCNETEGFYNLTSVNYTLNGTVICDSSVMEELEDIVYSLTVADHEEFIVQYEELNISNVNSCPSTTG